VLLDIEADQVIVKLASGDDVHEIGRAAGDGESRAREISSLLAASELVPAGLPMLPSNCPMTMSCGGASNFPPPAGPPWRGPFPSSSSG